MARIGFSGAPGKGDMLKSTYDPDKDGKIALAQLVAAVCSETEADDKISAAAILKSLLTTENDLIKRGAVGPERWPWDDFKKYLFMWGGTK